MKAIKLIFAFLLVVGCLVGALMLAGSEDAPIRQEISAANNRIAKYYDKFTQSWNDAADWDSELFRRNCADVSVLSAKYNVSELHDHNVNLAFQTVNSKMFDLWHSPDCTKADVDRYIAAIDTITAYAPYMENNDGVKKLREVYAVFAEADNFVHKGFGLQPRFNGNDGTWNDFNIYRDGQIQQRNKIKSNPLYSSHLSNITYLKDGLNQTEAKLGEARTLFYDALSRQIQNHYLGIDVSDRTPEKRNEFLSCINKFEAESNTNNGSLRALFKRYQAQ